MCVICCYRIIIVLFSEHSSLSKLCGDQSLARETGDHSSIFFIKLGTTKPHIFSTPRIYKNKTKILTLQINGGPVWVHPHLEWREEFEQLGLVHL